MTPHNRKQMISDVLTLEKGVKTRPDDIVQRSLWLWKRIASELVPLIGETGFQSLYGRAVHLALPHCGSFTLSKQGDSTEGVIDRLRQDLVTLEHDIAHQCSTLLITKFTDLVASMIGDVLMNQILRSAWQEHTTQPDS
ncbi:hypothetical protein SAMN06265795_109131 [Noviherbaspirillum humi]|uniref:Uncharacterized protein n=1 Tax=Noviherbaspirillum humi TaxID=1688639 RepID=A0A239IM45_9BURK|nr:hypothetical protein [Noviherbaspirillum humi]SNS93484.1 hypothetical protein SAMN06265795_109131 [Noviherbaspirillum humi]